MQTASFRLLAYAAVYEWYMCILWTVQVYLDQIAVCSHLTPVGPCPDQGCQSFRGACFRPKPFTSWHCLSTGCDTMHEGLVRTNLTIWIEYPNLATPTLKFCWNMEYDGDGLILFSGKPQVINSFPHRPEPIICSFPSVWELLLADSADSGSPSGAFSFWSLWPFSADAYLGHLPPPLFKEHLIIFLGFWVSAGSIFLRYVCNLGNVDIPVLKIPRTYIITLNKHLTSIFNG